MSKSRDPVVTFARRTGFVTIVLAMLAVISLAERNGLGFATVIEPSPDSRWVAAVRDVDTEAGVVPSLWLQDRHAGSWIRLGDLATEGSWCDTVVWSDDGRSVAFLVQGARAIVFDATTGARRADRWLVPSDGSPPQQRVVNLSLAADGTTVSYRTCPRVVGACSEVESLDLATVL